LFIDDPSGINFIGEQSMSNVLKKLVLSSPLQIAETIAAKALLPDKLAGS
jgi:hypothetical protein